MLLNGVEGSRSTKAKQSQSGDPLCGVRRQNAVATALFLLGVSTENGSA